MNFLDSREREELKVEHRRQRDRKVCDRIKAILLYDKGWTSQQIAKVLLISDQAVRNHISDYVASKKLNLESGGSSEKLSKSQAEKLETHLQEHTYLYVKDIVTYVKSRWSVVYTVPGMRSWLQRHQFSYKKPAIVPGKADKEKQKEWIEQYNILKASLPKEETICFMDGVHPTHNTVGSNGWIKKEQRKEIAANSGRQRLNLSGAIDILTHRVQMQEDKTLNSSSTITFLKKIEDAYPTKKKIHLFCDNARYYRNKDVINYLKNSKIELHFLPPYSPDLNPIERMWKWMKERTLYNTYYREFDDFRSAILGFFEAISSLPPDSPLGQEFRKKIGDRFRPIGAPLPNF